MTACEAITIRCRLNLAESNALVQKLGDADDLVVINSCTVTNEAVRQTRQAIRQARKRRPDARIPDAQIPDARIILTECAAQVDPESFAVMLEVASVLGNAEKQNISLFFEKSRNSKVLVSDIMGVRETAPHLVSAFSGKTCAFVEMQNGCDHRCTLCIIPYGRGNSRSVPADMVVDHIKEFVDRGFQEVVLSGVDMMSYGPDLPGKPNLGMLAERILKHIPSLSRLRLSTIDGVEIDVRLFDLTPGEPRVMPHVHLSLQAGDNMILKRMKRRHSRELAIELVARMQAVRPDIVVGADIIAGFPTETAAMFENSLKLINECNIVHGHIFPYSPKAGTPAALMPQVAVPAIKEQARIRRQHVAAKRSAWLASLVGSTQNIAIEKGGMSGHAENFAYVTVNCKMTKGSIVPVRVTAFKDKKLLAESIA